MHSDYTTAYIGLGSNLGDRAGNLLLAVRCMIEASFDVVRLSSIYETEPVGLDTDLMFLNMVAEVRVTNISHTQMMSRLLRIEYLLGRGDKTIKKPRTVDLDILFFWRDRCQQRILDAAASAIASTPIRPRTTRRDSPESLSSRP